MEIVRERGVSWAINRMLYSCKLKVLNLLPFTEKIFEDENISVKRIDILTINVSKLKRFLENLSTNEKEKIISDADAACAGRILGFSAVYMDFGYPMNWQLNPITGKAVDNKKKWFAIPDFDAERGDIKAVWEASRFTHFILLARAYLLTDDIKYYDAYKYQLQDWLANNPYSYGANYKCGQECAIRMMNCLLAYAVFKSVSRETESDIMEIVRCSYKKICSNFFYAYRCIKNNHTISELAGMIIGAWCCEDFNRLSKAYELLDEVICEQFSDDGGYIQNSFNYQRLAIQDIEMVLNISKTTGISLSDESKRRVMNSAVLMYQCLDISGDMPNYGSNDGALIFPVTSCDYRDFRPIINTIYTMLTGEKLFERGKYEEELIWFDVQDNCKKSELVQASSSFSKAGIYTMRYDSYWLMTILKDTVAHMDEQHVDLWVNGKNVLCDTGTYSYAEDLGKKLFSQRGHNTVNVLDRNQVYRCGPFATYGRVHLSHVDLAESNLSAEVEYSTGYKHRRTITSINKGFEIIDCIQTESQDAELLFHTPYCVTINGNVVTIICENREICDVVFSEQPKLREEVRSLYYLQSEPMNCFYVKLDISSGTATVYTKIIIKE